MRLLFGVLLLVPGIAFSDPMFAPENGRYSLSQSGKYLLDTRTGKMWETTEVTGWPGTFLVPVKFITAANQNSDTRKSFDKLVADGDIKVTFVPQN